MERSLTRLSEANSAYLLIPIFQIFLQLRAVLLNTVELPSKYKNIKINFCRPMIFENFAVYVKNCGSSKIFPKKSLS